MERYLVHLVNERYSPPDSRRLLHWARDLASGTGANVRLARVATGFVEFDVAAEARDLDPLLEALSPIGGVDNVRHVEEEEVSKEQGVRDGISYFNGERYWECHEALEGVWKQCSGREKEMVQGIILVAVAFAHAQENDEPIGVGMLGRALEKLGASPSEYHSIDVDRIRAKAAGMREARALTRFEI